MPKLHLYFHTPQPVFKARVNMASATYPIQNIIYDGVTLGSYTDIQFDSTLLLGTTEGADDLGRVRVKKPATSSIIYVSRSSRGVEDGTLTVQDNAYITVLDDYRVWAKLPYFNLTTGIDYKDGDVEVGDYTTTGIPPVANTGPGFADYIDPDTSVITVEFPGGGVDLSYAVSDGATLSTYAWDVGDGTITVGSASDAVITATFPAGFRWVALTVTDSNGVSHTSRCPVLAVDPADDVTYKHFQATQRLEVTGQTLDLTLFDDLSRSSYPDGTLVMFWWDAPSAPDDRDHMKFIGWVDKESYRVGRRKQGLHKGVSLHCLDVAGRLRILPGFPQALDNTETETPWSYMPDLDMHKALHYLLHWHSTAMSLADFIMPSGLQSYDALRLDFSGASLFDQMSTMANKIVPDHFFACNSKGQLEVIRNWMLDDVGDRPTTAPIITEDNWNNLSVEYNRHPKVHVLRSGALLATDTLVNGEIPLVFSVAPGDAEAFGQGTSEQQENEGLALSQSDLNTSEGHRYALLNSRWGDFNFEDPSGSDFWGYEPALLNRVQLNIGAAYAMQRGLPFTQVVGMVKSLDVRYQTDKRGTLVKVGVVYQREEEGAAATTYVPDETEPVEYVPPVNVIPLPGDGSLHYNDIKAYVVWDADEIARTWDLQEASPTWEKIDTGISGYIQRLDYMMVDANTCGAWLMTTEGIYFCADMMAVTPTWEEVMSIATVRAEQATPSSGVVNFATGCPYWSEPGFYCFATEPSTGISDYPGMYLWHTHDYGQTWEMVFDNTHMHSGRPYSHSNVWGMDIEKVGGRIAYIAATARLGGTGNMAMFYSEDGGHTINQEFSFDTAASQANEGVLSSPFPNSSDSRYVISGTTNTSAAKLRYSAGSGGLMTERTTPSPYTTAFGFANNLLPLNRHHDDQTHVLMIWHKLSAPTVGMLLESYDYGQTWTELYEIGTVSMTPNGWPADHNQWVVISAFNSDYADKVLITFDNFQTFTDKTGNLGSVFSETWTATNGFGSGFALPRVGPNV